MRYRILCGWILSLVCVALLLAPGAAGQAQKSTQRSASAKSKSSAKPTRRSGSKKSKKPSKKGSWKRRGQRGIQPGRVREIQTALIRENYLAGEPSGLWDQRTKDAMAHYQADNGWQNKVTPDSRALIKLGLGPDHSNLINPDTAASGPIPGGGAPAPSTPANRDQQ